MLQHPTSTQDNCFGLLPYALITAGCFGTTGCALHELKTSCSAALVEITKSYFTKHDMGMKYDTLCCTVCVTCSPNTVDTKLHPVLVHVGVQS